MESSYTEFTTNVEPQIAGKKEEEENKKYKLMAGTYIIGISGITAAVAGYFTTKIAKKRGDEYLKELGRDTKVVMESPHSLALRALAWGTFWAVGICSLTVFGLWKWYDIKDMDDLRSRIRKRTRKPGVSEGRTEFENLSDFLNYINETYKSKPEETKSS